MLQIMKTKEINTLFFRGVYFIDNKTIFPEFASSLKCWITRREKQVNEYS